MRFFFTGFLYIVITFFLLEHSHNVLAQTQQAKPACEQFRDASSNFDKLQIQLSYLNHTLDVGQIIPPIDEDLYLTWVAQKLPNFAPKTWWYVNEAPPINGLKIQIHPKTGRNHVVLVLEDDSKNCFYHEIRFAISAKKILFHGPLRPRKWEEAPDLNFHLFSYLEKTDALSAWNLTHGKGVTIAILDSGVDYQHPDLSPNILPNVLPDDLRNPEGPQETSWGGGQGTGWDFTTGDPFPMDDLGHGTHLAGIIAGALAGMAPEAKIIPIKVLNAFGIGDPALVREGIQYAIKQHVDIILMAFGSHGSEFLEIIKPALIEAEADDVLIVASAGNEGKNNDHIPHYPSGSGYKNILSVAALGEDGNLAPYSNFGSTSVDIAAPGGDPGLGEGLLGPSFDDKSHSHAAGAYIKHFGTSEAAAVTAGAAALVKSLYPELRGASLKKRLIDLGRFNPALDGRVRSSAEVLVHLP